MIQMGAPAEVVESYQKQIPQEEHFEVFEENIDTVRFFVDCQTQWTYLLGMAGMVATGFNYAGIESMMSMRGIENKTELFNELQLMERAALSIMNKGDK
jgi:Phage related hypothetical protein (DUF1799)